MWTREQLKSNAKMMFRRNYWPCVAVAFIMAIVETIGSSSGARNGYDSASDTQYYDQGASFVGHHPIFSLLTVSVIFVLGIFLIFFAIFIGNVLRVGGNHFFVLNRTEDASISTVFYGFKSGSYGNIVLTMFLKNLFTGLWTLLFVIPGIIKYYEYLMVPYVLSENPGMNYKEAFAISKRMMDGQKWDAFVLQLSFIGWGLLALITCNIVGIFYTQPYIEATMAELYAFNKAKAYNEGYIR